MEHRIDFEASVNIGYPNIVQRIYKDLGEFQPLDSKCCIYRVHEGLRKVKPEAYEPMVVSIGPYHLQNPRLQAMKRHKLHYLHSLLERRKNDSVERYIEELEKLEDRVRRYYAEPIDLNSEEFVEMMLLDACFIVEFYRERILRYLNPNLNFKLEVDWIRNQIYHDLLLLENQLPFFLLSRFYDMTKNDAVNPNHNPNDKPEAEDPIHEPNDDPEDPNHSVPGNNTPFLVLARIITINGIPSKFRNLEFDRFDNPMEIKHLLHLAHVLCCPNLTEQTSSGNTETKIELLLHKVQDCCRPLLKRICSKRKIQEENENRMHSAVELEEAGVDFKMVGEKMPFDIEFENGSMKIPSFSVDDSTDAFFRNLIAFEQYSSDVKIKYFTDFAEFMDQLISSEKDVKLLRHERIIVNWLGDDQEVSNLFNKLCDGVLFSSSNSCYYEVRQKVNRHCEKYWNRTRAKLLHDYFNSPWAGISTFGAIMLIVLAIVQTIKLF